MRSKGRDALFIAQSSPAESEAHALLSYLPLRVLPNTSTCTNQPTVLTYQAVAVADGHRGSWRARDVAHIQAFVVQLFKVQRAVAVVVPLDLGSGGHEPGVVAQAQVELPAEDGDVVVESVLRGHGLLVIMVTSWSFPLVIAYSYLPPPAPTGLPSCHVVSRDCM